MRMVSVLMPIGSACVVLVLAFAVVCVCVGVANGVADESVFRWCVGIAAESRMIRVDLPY